MQNKPCRNSKRLIVACECSGRVREAFRQKGWDAWSCDLKPSEDNSPYHLQGDIRRILPGDPHGWDMMIAFPDCTYLTSSGLHWNGRIAGRAEKTHEAIEFARFLIDQPIALKAMENPIGCLSTKIRPPEQIIQPYNFGEDASKSTCLWMKGLPNLQNTKYYPPRLVCQKDKCHDTQAYGFQGSCPTCGAEECHRKPRWGNQTDSGQNALGPSPTRAADRARTYQGIADAMATQWS